MCRRRTSALRCEQLEGDVVGVAEPQDVAGRGVLVTDVGHAAIVQEPRRVVQLGARLDPEADVVEADTVLVEGVRGDGTQAEQRIPSR